MAGESLVELSKALTGERGDKRNTKYALAALGGSAAGTLPLAALPGYKAAKIKAQQDMHAAIERAAIRGASPMTAVREGYSAGLKGLGKWQHISRAGGLGGAAAGVGGYAMYRNSKRKKAAGGVEKAMPSFGAMRNSGAEAWGGFRRGLEGRRMMPKKTNPKSKAAPVGMAALYGNRAGMTVNRYRTPLIAAGVGGTAGGAAGYFAGR